MLTRVLADAIGRIAGMIGDFVVVGTHRPL
jgi:hypothetical protein